MKKASFRFVFAFILALGIILSALMFSHFIPVNNASAANEDRASHVGAEGYYFWANKDIVLKLDSNGKMELLTRDYIRNPEHGATISGTYVLTWYREDIAELRVKIVTQLEAVNARYILSVSSEDPTVFIIESYSVMDNGVWVEQYRSEAKDFLKKLKASGDNNADSEKSEEKKSVPKINGQSPV